MDYYLETYLGNKVHQFPFQTFIWSSEFVAFNNHY